MRQIILDTETTGLEISLGHRIIEIAAVEMVNRRLTNNHFHQYLNPGREIDQGAQQVHGISLEFLQDKPLFKDVVQDFLDYVAGGELVIHNAPFDVGFLNYELGLLGMSPIQHYCPVITDTLKMAKALRPGQKNNLDALCKSYQIDNSKRTLHGALVDTELLSEVYLAMTRGQESLMMESAPAQVQRVSRTQGVRQPLRVLAAAADELLAHQQYLEALDKASRGSCVWKLVSQDA
ncbi:DNA polymerase III subunit epsilon [Sulfurimicrobium lacus]|uniref:DNA polymerase III subunit epsilon n=1 Tax=Sulfurimicrobium lacus TaxID=2715678 RepID=A0A6F8VDB3_9PROT|nr:DNA polymerase III subunit epsilon [Sulfurimicrobium lacus]BCB26729.1 DNA polymerase III subunit epsilon [Sulfurimicrobium lacus]